MGQKIERDLQRFRKIVRGKVKSDLAKYISRGEMIGKKGNDLVSIPLPSIEIPQFRYGQKNSGGVGVGRLFTISISVRGFVSFLPATKGSGSWRPPPVSGFSGETV